MTPGRATDDPLGRHLPRLLGCDVLDDQHAAWDTPAGVRGEVVRRWFTGLSSGVVTPDPDAVVRFLAELDEATGER